MATATFDRTFVVTDAEAQKKLQKIFSSDKSILPLTCPPFTEEERDRSEALLKQCLSRSKR